MRNFQPITHRISETVQDRPQLLLMTNRKSHMRFDWYQDHQPWMTLNCYKFKFSGNFALGRVFGR